MHEYSLVEALLQRVTEEARTHAASRRASGHGPHRSARRRRTRSVRHRVRSLPPRNGLCDDAELVITGEDVDVALRCLRGGDPAGSTLDLPGVRTGRRVWSAAMR